MLQPSGRSARTARRVAEILVPLLLIAVHAGAAPRPAGLPADANVAVEPPPTERVAQRTVQQDVAAALAQRLDRMLPSPQRTPSR